MLTAQAHQVVSVQPALGVLTDLVDVVHLRRCCVVPHIKAVCTQREALDVAQPDPAPCAIISAFGIAPTPKVCLLAGTLTLT